MGFQVAFLALQAAHWAPGPPLPQPAANNAVAALETTEGWEVYSFLGLDTTRRWDGIQNRAFRWRLADSTWVEIASVPGPGRLAGTAQAVRGRVYLFGGYTVAEDGTERSAESVDVYDPEAESWSRGASIPIPTDDAVSGVWRDSLIFLISGWHDTANVALVQIYDPQADAWRQATPIPGPPVFGHAGALAGNTIVYVDGVRMDRDPRRFTAEASSWLGEIDPTDPTRIAWRQIAAHPGPALYRAGAGRAEGTVLFAGGTDNPYNYDGIGYDGVVSRPLTGVFRYLVNDGSWEVLPPLPRGVMDLRGVVRADGRWIIVGGMHEGRRVSDAVWVSRP